MQKTTRQKLLELNQTFYSTVAESFNRTRMGFLPGLWRLLEFVPTNLSPEQPLTVVDVGCGNGRFGHILESLERPCLYVGADRDASLLEFAQENTADCTHLQPHFCQIELGQQGWSAPIKEIAPAFDIVCCLATLHHIPSYELRLQVVSELASLVANEGVLMLATWQFLCSERLRNKRVPWQEVGLTPEDVEPGDFLLPWQAGPYALRYVHQIDEAEMTQMASDLNLKITASYRSDGREGNLSLYTVFNCENV